MTFTQVFAKLIADNSTRSVMVVLIFKLQIEVNGATILGAGSPAA